MVVRRQRVVPAAAAEVWEVVSDPLRLPAWWPGVTRVEEASREAWTTVLVSPKGKQVRADYSLVDADEPERLLWRHEVEASPFERLLAESTVALDLERDPAGAGTRVRLTRWWGWGEDGHAVPLPAVAEALLRDELGADPAARRPPVSLEQVSVPDGRLPESARERLAAAVGSEHVRDDRDDRIRHAVGRSYPDLVRIRSGDAASAPDAVGLPASAEQVGAVLAACAEHRIAVVPFGGGTSVVGGVEPVRDGMAATVTLDLGRLASSVEVDSTSLTARLDAGLLGPDVERRLREQGVTLGHFPQSFEYSTVGGWVATRSAGQASPGYGRIDELVEALRRVTPVGEISTLDAPATAAGPSLR